LYLVSQIRKTRSNLLGGHQSEGRVCYTTRKELLAPTKRHRPDLNDDLVQQSGIIELACQIPAAADPDIFRTCGRTHLGVNGPDIPPRNTNVVAFKQGYRST
jgi:hypothetical protein